MTATSTANGDAVMRNLLNAMGNVAHANWRQVYDRARYLGEDKDYARFLANEWIRLGMDK